MAVHEDGISLLHLNSMVVCVFLLYCCFLSLRFTIQKVIMDFSYKLVATFGGQEEDFMLVINHQQQQTSGRGRPSVETEKILLSMSKLAVSAACLIIIINVTIIMHR